MAHRSVARAKAPRLLTVTSCVLTALGIATVGLLQPESAHAATGGRVASSNRDFVSLPASRPARTANRTPRGTVQRAPSRPAGSIVVANCDDAGPGSLRQAFVDAVDDDVIDLTGLACSTITLTSGALVSSASLTLQGPGAANLAIDGNASSLVIQHLGTSLTINAVTIRNGQTPTGYGGCVWAGGNLTMSESVVTGCTAGSGANAAGYGAGLDVIGDLALNNSTVTGNTSFGTQDVFGGGIYVAGVANLTGSTVSGNLATSAGNSARGGGVFSRGNAVAYLGTVITDNRVEATGTAYGGGIQAMGGLAAAVLSTISGNSAHSEAQWSYGGGLHAGDGFGYVEGDVVVIASTISGNSATANCGSCFIQGGGVHAFGQAAFKYSTVSDNVVASGEGTYGTSRGGGAATFGYEADGEIQVYMSTISGNAAIGGSSGGYGYGGGLAAIAGNVRAVNSTIAFNFASTAGGGLTASTYYNIGTGESYVTSTIVASNSAPASADIGMGGVGGADTLVVVGDHNLVGSTDPSVTLPPDTLVDDPRLLPLANYGGPTATHALAACSPAIDAGSNPSAWETDQRLNGYVREFDAGPDIGAFELQPDLDRVFADGFEPLPCS
ncbi:MAG TPA: choice-of-anchor Q domain-containing protein [Dokdonella sp.]